MSWEFLIGKNFHFPQLPINSQGYIRKNKCYIDLLFAKAKEIFIFQHGTHLLKNITNNRNAQSFNKSYNTQKNIC